ncbi:MAG TPA: hypothetical protein PKN48_13725 [Bacteroidales bacterium]|nr:hypothetical protein [Bacteroidales bacterium]
MKKIYLFVLISISISVFVSAQNSKQDVVYLNNGSIIRGKITEQIYNTSLKIQTADNNVFAYNLDEISNIKRELVPAVINDTHDTIVLKTGQIITGKIIEPITSTLLKIKTAESSIFVFRINEINKTSKEISQTLQNNAVLDSINNLKAKDSINKVLSINNNLRAGASTIRHDRKKYYQNGQPISFREVKIILANNPASAPEISKYKTINGVSTAIYVIGGMAAIGGSIVSLVSTASQVATVSHGRITYPQRDYTGTVIMFGGIGLELVGALVGLGKKKHLENSINNYNSNFQNTSYFPVRFDFMANSDGLGIRMRF